MCAGRAAVWTVSQGVRQVAVVMCAFRTEPRTHYAHRTLGRCARMAAYLLVHKAHACGALLQRRRGICFLLFSSLEPG